jgi:signal transduction histidine kinase
LSRRQRSAGGGREENVARFCSLCLSVAAAAALLVTGAGCNRNAAYPSVSSLSREWFDIKTNLSSPDAASGADDLETRIGEFHGAVNRFFASPVGALYQVHGLDAGTLYPAFTRAAENLKSAVRSGKSGTVFSNAAEIDALLFQIQNFDTDISNSIHAQYFYLFFFFTMLIIAVIFSLRLLQGRLEKAQTHERQSRAFSHETMMIQEKERSRIARELHDSVAQDLWRLSFQTDGAGKTEDSAERRRLCTEIIQGQNDLMNRIRRICDALIPPDFQHQGLLPSLRRLCRDFERRTGAECRVTIQDDLHLGKLDPETQLQCFRLVQEALANTEKHAHASEAVVVVRNGVRENGGNGKKEETLLICVSDDGRGFAAPEGPHRRFAAEGHFGIRNMYERAAIVCGALTIDSEPGEGVTITLEIPL